MNSCTRHTLVLLNRCVNCCGNHRIHVLLGATIFLALRSLSVASGFHALSLRFERFALFRSMIAFFMQHTSFLPLCSLGLRLKLTGSVATTFTLIFIGLASGLLEIAAFNAFKAFTKRDEILYSMCRRVETL